MSRARLNEIHQIIKERHDEIRYAWHKHFPA
ncbi:MAG: hypothetical protein ACYCXP_12350 [Leptospirillum sp.]